MEVYRTRGYAGCDIGPPIKDTTRICGGLLWDEVRSRGVTEGQQALLQVEEPVRGHISGQSRGRKAKQTKRIEGRAKDLVEGERGG